MNKKMLRLTIPDIPGRICPQIVALNQAHSRHLADTKFGSLLNCWCENSYCILFATSNTGKELLLLRP